MAPSCRLRIDSWTTCKMGNPKAPVLPLPVSAAASTSPPPRIKGMHSYWMAVGSLHHTAVTLVSPSHLASTIGLYAHSQECCTHQRGTGTRLHVQLTASQDLPQLAPTLGSHLDYRARKPLPCTPAFILHSDLRDGVHARKHALLGMNSPGPARL